MFRNVPACSGMFHVPGFIDGLSLIAFCCGGKVGSLADVEFTLVWCGSLADSLLQLSFVLALV